ncbi:MAG: NADH-quinone oxidoreductase subunit M [Magnetococcales bacterium]|nr:NADH-quinone oxidoreductase subunit M [Magnetococcales bacterium]
MIASTPPHLLSLVIAWPLVGALLAWLVPTGQQARRVALIWVATELVLAVIVMLNVDFSRAGFQLLERHAWIPSLGIEYRLGVDGVSALFLPATALLFLAAVVASWHLAQRVMPRLYFALLLFLEGVTLGIFCAADLVLFFLFWELTLIPLHFLIALWGIGPNRRHAAVKYTLFMLAGGAALLIAFLLVAQAHPGPQSFDLLRLLHEPLAIGHQWPVFFLLLFGFGVKIPLVPLHVWLPIVAMEGPVAVTAILTGIKLGAYGLIRLLLPLTPDVAQQMYWLLAGLGVVSMVYGALSALAQTNLRRLFAFSSISHMGMVVLGLATFTIQGVQGAVFYLLNMVLVSGGLFLSMGMIHHRLGSTDLLHLGGLARPMPLLSGFFLLFGLASIGLPLTSGFPGEFLLLTSVLHHHIGSGLAALGSVILGAGYLIGCYRHAFLGPLNPAIPADLPPLLFREQALLIGMAVLILVIGWFPNLILESIRPAAEVWLER